MEDMRESFNIKEDKIWKDLSRSLEINACDMCTKVSNIGQDRLCNSCRLIIKEQNVDDRLERELELIKSERLFIEAEYEYKIEQIKKYNQILGGKLRKSTTLFYYLEKIIGDAAWRIEGDKNPEILDLSQRAIVTKRALELLRMRNSIQNNFLEWIDQDNFESQNEEGKKSIKLSLLESITKFNRTMMDDSWYKIDNLISNHIIGINIQPLQRFVKDGDMHEFIDSIHDRFGDTDNERTLTLGFEEHEEDEGYE